MPARVKKIRHDENTRNKIRSAFLINRLTDYVAGKIQLESAQVTAALGLLKKTVPDQQSVEHSGEVTKTYVIRTPEPSKNVEQWREQHSQNQTIQ